MWRCAQRAMFAVLIRFSMASSGQALPVVDVSAVEPGSRSIPPKSGSLAAGSGMMMATAKAATTCRLAVVACGDLPQRHVLFLVELA